MLVASEGVGSLSWLKNHPHQQAKPGGRGAKSNRTGPNAPDLVLEVPVGTVVKHDSGQILADLAAPGDRICVARGGRGGRGNAALTSARRRAPGFAELGEPGTELWLTLELRLIADVAVLGIPNAGKSTLVGAVSAAHPRVADYPFTTLEPTLGVVERGERRFTICDIPGLIEGAHRGRGLGLKFLRHVQRSAIFLHVVDVSQEEPWEAYETVRHELGAFDEDLLERPHVAALNKVDLVDAQSAERALRRFSDQLVEAFLVSATEGVGLDALLDRLLAMVEEERKSRPAAKGFELFETAEEPLSVKREEGGWRIQGAAVKRWVAMTDMSNPEAVAYLQGRLERAGVEEMLARAGAKPGDEVRIDGAEFNWWPTGTIPEAQPRAGSERDR